MNFLKFLLSLIILTSCSSAFKKVELLNSQTHSNLRLPNSKYESLGFYSVKNISGVWWLINPDGELFLSKGVTTVHFSQDKIKGTNISPYRQTNLTKYGSIENWRMTVAERLLHWGFNTLGAWSDIKISDIDIKGKSLAFTKNLNFAGTYNGEPGGVWVKGAFPDVFDPNFKLVSQRLAEKICKKHKDDPNLLGWFTDNELRWAPDWRGREEVLTLFLAYPSNSIGKKVAIDLLKSRYLDIEKFNETWQTNFKDWEGLRFNKRLIQPVDTLDFRKNGNGNELVKKIASDCDAFIGLVAEEYFRITTNAIRKVDPNHLNFGPRFAYLPPKTVVVVAKKYLDVVAFNSYSIDPSFRIEQFSVFELPLLIGEFSFVSKDSGLPNSTERKLELHMNNQKERGEAFRNYVMTALKSPKIVGYHWFEHADQPKEGRFDGQNSNYGIVNINDDPYLRLVEAMMKLNSEAETLHSKSR